MSIFGGKAREKYRKFVGGAIILEKEVGHTNTSITWLHYYTYARAPFATSLTPKQLEELLAAIAKEEKEKKKRYVAKQRPTSRQLTLLPHSPRAKNPKLQPLGYLTARVMPLGAIANEVNEAEPYELARAVEMADSELVGELTDFFPLKYLDERLKDYHEKRGVGTKAIDVVLKDLIDNYGVKFIFLEPSRAARNLLLKRKYGFREPERASKYIYRRI